MIWNRLFNLMALLLLMAGLRLVENYTGWSTEDNLALKLGFVLLVGYLVGELVVQCGLPRVTGYLLCGIVCGPDVVAILNRADLGRLSFINELALSLIGFTAGAELKIGILKSRKKTISLITFSQLVTIIPIVFAVFFLIAMIVPEFRIMPWHLIVVMGMLIGVISFSTSPATQIAVIVESKSAGSLTDAILGVTIVMDVFVIILFAVTFAVARSIMPEFQGEGSLLKVIAWELFGSIGIGIISGAGISLFNKYIRKGSLVLFIIILAFVITRISHLLHLHFILVCITAGFVVENMTSAGHRLVQAIERGSLPVYIVFFSMAGAAIELSCLYMTGVAALAIVFSRGVGIWTGVRAAIRLAGENKMMEKYCWMGFVSQAGVSIGLVMMVANAFPQIADSFKSLMFSVIAINQIVGPVALKYALSKAKETGQKG